MAIGDLGGTIEIAPGRYRECAVQSSGHIAYVAVRAHLAIFEGALCEGKAVLVLRGAAATIDGLVFENLHVADGNAAGIRIERGNLHVMNSVFRDSDEGILGADDIASDVKVEGTLFTRLGRCDQRRSCAHSLYLGRYRSLTISGSRFEQGRGGHYVKSRARWIDVSDSTFDDREGVATNYMIDLPEGASGRIVRNHFTQGRSKENHSAFIAVSSDSQRNMSRLLFVTDNRGVLSLGVDRPVSFVVAPPNAVIAVSRNRLDKGIRSVSTWPASRKSIKDRLYRMLKKTR
ncbi:MAG: hypothetical protein ABL878_17700 [Burkholderiales bacterium]